MGVLKFQNVGAGAWRADTGERRTWKIDVDQHGHFFVGVSGQFEGQIGYWPFDRLNDAIVFCENSEMDERQREDTIDAPPATEAAAPSEVTVTDAQRLWEASVMAIDDPPATEAAAPSEAQATDAERLWDAGVMAMMGMFSRPEVRDISTAKHAEMAFTMAEAMLAEWKKRAGAEG